jgi:hypothetical protein
MFENVVLVAFQNVFCSKIHQNNIFYFKKFIFDISTSKRSKNNYKIIFLKKNLNLNEKQVETQCQILPNTTLKYFGKIVHFWMSRS